MGNYCFYYRNAEMCFALQTYKKKVLQPKEGANEQ
jgi:hypothetical protein